MAKTRRLKIPLLAEVEKAIDWPASQWVGECYAVASAICEAFPGLGRPVYGHYLGRVDPKSSFNPGRPFQRHGWVELADGRILDPTLWTFLGADPYLHVGPPDDDHDEGGDVWRESLRRQDPPPAPNGQPCPLSFEDEDARLFIHGIFLCWPERLHWNQVMWLANRPRSELGEFAGPIYEAIIGADEIAMIPIDNRRKVLGGDR